MHVLTCTIGVAMREQVAVVFVDRRCTSKRGPRLLAKVAIDFTT